MKGKTILGCWCTEPYCKFIDDKHIQTELVAHIWYAYDNDSKTDVINKKICFVKEINFDANDEVEIIEEDKKIEKLNLFDLTVDNNEKDEDGNDLKLHYTGVADTFDEVYDKINELIEELNKLKERE